MCGVLSKCASSPALLLNRRPQQAARNVLLLLAVNGNGRRCAEITAVRHGGHARVFTRRHGTLLANRIKDIWHFYVIGLGFIPIFMLISVGGIVFGTSCELKPYPKPGEQPPHYWQFERTPFKQFWARYFSPTDMQYHETWTSRFSNSQVKDRWRKIEDRVKHLINERLDYKAYLYHPMSNEWVDLAKREAAQMQHQLVTRQQGTTQTMD